MDAGVIVAIVMGLVNLFVLGAGGIWKIADLKSDLKEAIFDTRTTMASQIELTKREFGETIAALREALTQQALWNRDHFIQAGPIDDIKSLLTNLTDRFDTRLMRMEAKLRGQADGD